MKENKGWKQKKEKPKIKEGLGGVLNRDMRVPGTMVETRNQDLFEEWVPIEKMDSQVKFRDLLRTAKERLKREFKELSRGKKKEKKKKEEIKEPSIQKLLEHNAELQDKLKRRQQTFVRREQRSKEVIMDLQEKLESATSFYRKMKSLEENSHHLTDEQKRLKEQGEYENLVKMMKEKKVRIQNGIDKIQKDTKQVLEDQKKLNQEKIKEMESRFEVILKNEKKERLVKKQDIIEKSRLFKQLFDEFKQKAEDLDERNIKLTEDNIKLRIGFESQKGNDEKWALKNLKYKKENEKLQNIVDKSRQKYTNLLSVHEELKTEYLLVKKATRQASRKSSGRGKVEREMFEKLKKQLETEKKNFQVLKRTYIDLMYEKSELEIFLRQCIDDVRKNILTTKNLAAHNEVQFAEKEREKVIQLLLSKESVLKLLYQKTFRKYESSTKEGEKREHESSKEVKIEVNENKI